MDLHLLAASPSLRPILQLRSFACLVMAAYVKQ
jgi:hypothetical protein